MKSLVAFLVCLIGILYTQRRAIQDRFSIPSHNMSATTTSTTSTPFIGLPVIPPNDPSLNAEVKTPRTIRKVFEAVDTPEGAGARVRRSVGTGQLR